MPAAGVDAPGEGAGRDSPVALSPVAAKAALASNAVFDSFAITMPGELGGKAVHSEDDESGSGANVRAGTLLADIPPDQQLCLRFERICATVSTSYDQPGMLTRLRHVVRPAERAAATEAQRKQVRASS